MSNSEHYTLHISFNQPIYGIKLELINGNLEVVYNGLANELHLQLPQGIYHLKIVYMDYYQEKFFSMSGDTELKLDFNYPLTIPVLGYSTTHQYYSEDAEKYSRAATMGNTAEPPNFFFFAALHDKDKPGIAAPSEWLTHYRIFNIDKTVDTRFNKTNSVFDDEVGKLYFSVFLNPGLYFFSYENELNPRIFPLYIFDGHQTQFFIRYTNLPDFKNCRFFISSRKSFNELAIEYFVLEKILYAYADFNNFEQLTPEEINVIRGHPYLVSLVNILFTAVQQMVAADHNKTIYSPVKDCTELALPDIVYCRSDRNEVYRLSDKPPLLSFIITKYTHQLENGHLVFEPASILDRIVDNANYDLFWNNFSKIDEPDNWTSIYRPILRTIDQSSNALIRTVANAKHAVMNYWKPQFDDNLKHLTGKANLSEEEVDSFNGTISKIKDLPEMAKEFGLAPTTILRNYKKYYSYYNQIKQREDNKKTTGKRRPIVIWSGALALLIGIYFFGYLPMQQTDKNAEVVVAMASTTKEETPAAAVATQDTMVSADLGNDITAAIPDKEPLSTASSNQTLTQDKMIASNQPATIIPAAPPVPKYNDYAQAKSADSYGSATRDDNNAGIAYEKATIGKGEKAGSYDGAGSISRERSANNIPWSEKNPKAELLVMKKKDSLNRYHLLTTLLNKSQAINNTVKDSIYTYESAKTLFQVNSDILKMINADPGYFSPQLSITEVNTLQEYCKSWIRDYNSKQVFKEKNIISTTGLTLNNHLPFPVAITKKINASLKQMKLQVNNTF